MVEQKFLRAQQRPHGVLVGLPLRGLLLLFVADFLELFAEVACRELDFIRRWFARMRTLAGREPCPEPAPAQLEGYSGKTGQRLGARGSAVE